MKQVIFSIIIFLFLWVNTFAMSNQINNMGKNLPYNMNEYTLQIYSSNILNFQGIVAYYDETGNVKTSNIFGTTPYIYYLQSKDGVSAFFHISKIQPFNSFGSVLKILLYKNNKFIKEKSFFITDNQIQINYGNYPKINLDLMMMPQ